jgi:pseudo-rSAM protein
MKNTATKFWFYLEPSIFIFKGKSQILFYDSESSKKIIFEESDSINKLINSLLDINNMYCISVNETDLKDISVHHFIEVLRDSYMADIIPYSTKGPVVVPPVMKCHADKPKKDKAHAKGTNVMSVLNEITFYLNGKCYQQCKYCLYYFKQFSCCHKDKGELPLADVIKIIDNIISVSLSSKINFNGGDIFLYSQIEELLIYLKEKKIKSNIYFNYLNWNGKYKDMIFDGNIILHIYITTPIDYIQLQHTINIFKHKLEVLQLIFIVRNEQELLSTQTLINDFEIQQYSLVPFYDSENLYFFEQVVFTNVDDLLSASPTKHDIYKRQYVNMFDFGKLTLSSSGKYYSNMNFVSLGNITEDIVQIVGKEWVSGKVWKRTRDTEPCKNCIYQYLCPSPSNYEIAIGKNNLCNITAK